jgi:hypothetical protein
MPYTVYELRTALGYEAAMASRQGTYRFLGMALFCDVRTGLTAPGDEDSRIYFRIFIIVRCSERSFVKSEMSL